MAYTPAAGKATAKYKNKSYDRCELLLKKGEKDAIKAYAESKGMSLNAYINALIERDMNSGATPET